MRTVFLAIVLAALAVIYVGEVDKDKFKQWSESDGRCAMLAESYIQFRRAAMEYVGGMDRAMRTAQLIDNGHAVDAVPIRQSDLDGRLPGEWKMPKNASGGDAWKAWLTWYVKEPGAGLDSSGDYFGAARNAHVVLWVASGLEDENEAALAFEVYKALDGPRGLGLACTDVSEDSRCASLYGALSVPAFSMNDAIEFKEGGLVSAVFFERAMTEGDVWSEYRP